MNQIEFSTVETTYCATHPGVQTTLRCGKCGKPICPRCLVHTPVGARCRACAHLRKLPTYSVSASTYLLAAGVGLAAAAGVGAFWGVFMTFFGGLFGLILAAAAGYVIGELVSSAANRKRSRGLKLVAGGCTMVAYLVSQTASFLVGPVIDRLPAAPLQPGMVGALALGAILGALTNPFTLIAVGLAVFFAVSRFR